MTIVNYIFSEETVEALGWTLLHALWQGGIFAIALSLVLIYMQQFSSKSRYLVSVIFVFFFFLASVVTFFMVYEINSEKVNPFTNRSSPVQEITSGNNSAINSETEGESTREENHFLDRAFHKAEIYFKRHIPLIVTIWLLGVLVLSLKFLGGLAYVQRMKYYRAAPVSEFWQKKAEELQAKINLNYMVVLRNSYLATTPMVIGIFKPVILIPVQVLTGLKEKQIETILAHELAHIKRNDYAVNILQSLLEILFFYHPAIWWMSSVVRSERENSCDDIAVQITGQRFDFAEALVNIQESRIIKNIPAVSLSGNKNSFAQRIKRILNKPTIFADFKEGFVTAFIIITCLGLVALSAFKFTGQPNSTDQEMAVTSLTLHEAVEHNNLSAASQLIQSGAYIEKRDDEGYTPLMQAVKNNNYEISRLLVEHGAYVNALRDEGRTLLIEAGDEDDSRITELLVDNGADINAEDDDGWTALLEAVENDKKEIALILINNGAKIEKRDEDGYPPLMRAVKDNNYEMSELLINQGANVNAEKHDGWNVLLEAGDEDDARITELLIENGANVNKGNEDGWSPLMEAAENDKYEIAETLLAHGADLEARDEEERTPLIAAVQNDNYNVTRLLLENNASMEVTNRSGWTPLIHAADEDDSRLISLLIDHGADVNAGTISGWTALFEAVSNEKYQNAKILIENGAEVNISHKEFTPLRHAVRENRYLLTKLLIDHNADVNAKGNKNGTTILLEAAEEDNARITSLLLNNGARIHESRYDGKTALFEAIDEGKEAIAQILIDHGAKVNNAYYNGLTPLMYAIEEEDFEMVILLVENGADIDAKSKSGWSVWEIAQKEDDEEILEFLNDRLN